MKLKDRVRCHKSSILWKLHSPLRLLQREQFWCLLLVKRSPQNSVFAFGIALYPWQTISSHLYNWFCFKRRQWLRLGLINQVKCFILNIYLNKINISRELSDEIMEEVNLLIPHKAHLAPLVPTCCLKRLNYICYLRPLDYSSPKSSLWLLLFSLCDESG